MNFYMLDHNPDDDEYDYDFNQWLVGANSEKPVPPRKLFTTIEEESYRPQPLRIRKPKLDKYGNEIEDDGYRNPGGGSGRPHSTNPASKSISIRVTPCQHEKFLSFGGCKWIKEIIDEAPEQKSPYNSVKE